MILKDFKGFNGPQRGYGIMGGYEGYWGYGVMGGYGRVWGSWGLWGYGVPNPLPPAHTHGPLLGEPA